MGLVGAVVKVVGALLLVLVGLFAFLWFTDYGAQATITDRADGCVVEVTPKLWPSYHHRTAVDCDVWPFVCEGFEVTFHIQTKEFIVTDRSGRVVYDSASGETDTVGLARCGATNLV